MLNTEKRPWNRMLIGGVFLVLLCGLQHGPATPASAMEKDELPPLPHFKNPVDKPENIDKLYGFVALHPEVYKYMPCFCACSRTKGHRSNDECFVKSRGKTLSSLKWSGHAAECTICLTVAAQVQDLYLQGKSLQEIRTAVEQLGAKFNKFHTDTPLPPRAQAEPAAAH